jgi:DoxX-like protein
MSETLAVEAPKRWLPWVGRAISALPAALLLFSASLKITSSPLMVDGLGKAGFSPGLVTAIGVLELACLAIYLVPPTAVLGALLLTGYLGGAVVTHLRVGQPLAMPVVIGVLVWAGLYLRDARVRAILPLR